MTLEDLGYTAELENYRKDQNLDTFGIGRVISEHRERYLVKTTEKECDGEIIGNLRYTASNRSDFPAVGDWVAISEYDVDKVLIHAVLPRKTLLERQAVGKQGERQLIAANIDYAFIVQAVDRDFKINRIERYLTLCHTAKVKPLVVITKTDLINAAELAALIQKTKERLKDIPVFAISNEDQTGIEGLKGIIEKSKTYCLLGSSGVGKSTLLNNLLGKQVMNTGDISEHSHRGRHVTSHRELHILENGGILIDNPGMREVGITSAADGLQITFDEITALSKQCKFKNCTHISETGCAVLAAVESGTIDEASYENYLKMQREKDHFERSVAEKRKKDRDFGKMIRNFQKHKKLNK